MRNAPYFQYAEDVIDHFYTTVNMKNYDVAFNCLTPSFRCRKWDGDQQNFAKDYDYTVKIALFDVAPFEPPTPIKAEYHISYAETRTTLHHPLLEDLSALMVDASSTAQKRIKEFKQFMI